MSYEVSNYKDRILFKLHSLLDLHVEAQDLEAISALEEAITIIDLTPLTVPTTPPNLNLQD